jgi:hypothetical protein
LKPRRSRSFAVGVVAVAAEAEAVEEVDVAAEAVVNRFL